MDNTHCIYFIINTNNWNFYVGRTSDFERRKRCHWHELKEGLKSGHFQNSWAKHGPRCFRMVTAISGLNEQQAIAWEQMFLDFCYGKQWCLNNSNDAKGGRGRGFTQTPESNKARSETMKAWHEANPWKGEKTATMVKTYDHRAKVGKGEIVAESPKGETFRFASALEASEKLGLNRRSIERWIKQPVKYGQWLGWTFSRP